MRVTYILKKIEWQYKNNQKLSYEKNLFFFKIYRPISFYLTVFFIFLRLKPNFITFLNFLLILGSCLFLLKGFTLFGLLFLLLSFIFDLIDGNLARYYQSNNSFGKIADGFVDSLIFLVFFFYSISLIINEQKIYNENITLLIGALTSVSFLFKICFDIRCNYVLIRDEKRNKNIEYNSFFKKINSFMYIKNIINDFYLGIPLILIISLITGYPTYGLIFYFFIIFFFSNLEILLKLFLLWKKFNR